MMGDTDNPARHPPCYLLRMLGTSHVESLEEIFTSQPKLEIAGRHHRWVCNLCRLIFVEPEGLDDHFTEFHEDYEVSFGQYSNFIF